MIVADCANTGRQHEYHAVHFYEDSHSLAEAVAPFLCEGLRGGQEVWVASTRAHVSALVTTIERLGLDTSELKAAGKLRVFDARTMLSSFMVAGRLDEQRFKSQIGDKVDRLCAGRGSSPVRMYGEMVDLLYQDGNIGGAIRLEKLWSPYIKAYDIPMLCGYAVNHFHRQSRDSSGFADVCRLHSHVHGAIPERPLIASFIARR
jgi:hypothetical protein